MTAWNLIQSCEMGLAELKILKSSLNERVSIGFSTKKSYRNASAILVVIDRTSSRMLAVRDTLRSRIESGSIEPDSNVELGPGFMEEEVRDALTLNVEGLREAIAKLD